MGGDTLPAFKCSYLFSNVWNILELFYLYIILFNLYVYYTVIDY